MSHIIQPEPAMRAFSMISRSCFRCLAAAGAARAKAKKQPLV
ncbi:hypothetical protein ACU4GD_24995 [Cupriavidus basilensis]